MANELHYLSDQKSYLLAVSGGVDSMVLAHLFLQQKFTFSVAHCNFQLRGEESQRETELVQHWCEQHAITCHVKYMQTDAYATEHKLSIQLAARQLRYSFFDELKAIFKYDFIVTAHHRNDTIETVLFNFFRGTGLPGLTGIPAERNGIIRPLLQMSRQEIEEYALLHQVPFRVDSSNLKEDYTRNKMRLTIIPELQNMFPSFEENMIANINRFAEIRMVYEKQIAVYRKKLMEPRGKDFYLPILKLKHIQPLVTILYELVKPFGFSAHQIPEIIALMDRQTGGFIQSDTYRIIKNRNFLILTLLHTSKSDFILLESSTKTVSTSHFTLVLKKQTASKAELKLDTNSCCIDASLVSWPLLLRPWRQGDYLYPFGMEKKKKVAKVLIDAKIPLHEKENCWVIESNRKIVWVLGVKADNRFRITPKTKEVIYFNLK
jgi:tRNA(Ile)-lysidine synthase